MANDLKVRVVMSPDMKELIDQAEATVAKLRERIEDPRVMDVFRQLATMRPDESMDHERIVSEPGTVAIMVHPGDRFLEVLAKMRALERVLC